MFMSRLVCVSVLVALAFAPVTSGARPRAHRPIRHSRSARRHASNPEPVAPFNPPAPIINPATFSWNIDKQGGFVMSLCADLHGRLYVGTEDRGVWQYDSAQPAGKTWTQFTTRDGLGDDNAYALCCDRLGRVWAGNLNHGVSVFDGVKWKNYDILNGPLGSHVVALAVNPTNGNVWGATEAGLFRYREKQKDWQYITRADGLPSDQASCLAFSKTGTLYVGTQCDGLVIGDANAEHPKWRNVRGMDTLPLTASGEGLPTNLINCLLVTDDALWVGTPTGLACSKDGAKTFTFIRGKDYKAKIAGLLTRPKVAANAPEGALAEDYVTCLAQSATGALIIGHRQQAPEMGTGTRFAAVPDAGEPYVTCISSGVGKEVIAHYGTGLTRSGIEKTASTGSFLKTNSAKPLPFPAAALSPNENDINNLLRYFARPSVTLKPGDAVALGDDWMTQGDWVGRYGRQYAVMCAARAPIDHVFSTDLAIKVVGDIGPHRDPGDALRHWVQWEHTEDHRAMWDPLPGYRRDGTWDDHGEVYDRNSDGVNLVISVDVPAGVHRLSLYFMNKDGHSGDNRYRDYVIEVASTLPMPPTSPGVPPCRARVVNFWSGVYKQFVVVGPSTFTVNVAKNYSLNTIMQAVLVDRLSGLDPRELSRPLPAMGRVRYVPIVSAISGDRPTDLHIAPSLPRFNRTMQLLKLSADGAYQELDGIVRERFARVSALRAQTALGAPDTWSVGWRWNIPAMNAGDHREFEEVMKKAHASMLQLNPKMVGLQY